MTKEMLGTTIRLVLQEGLTANNVPKFNQFLENLIPEDNAFEQLELDLNQTENIDSVGVTFVIALYKRLKSSQKSFKVSGASEDVQSLFKLMKLDQFFEMTH